jgi:beta-xylosidase
MIRHFLFGLVAVLLPSLASLPAAVTPGGGRPTVILRGDYPDPSILRDGDDYYLTHSPFLYAPGFLIWHSRDLVHWKPICRAMTKVVGSAMAPDLVKYEGKYYIYFPADGCNWVIHADNIRGPWSDPVRLDTDHIDPGHVVDEMGRRWLFLSEGYRIRLADDGLSVIGKKEQVYAGWNYPADWQTEGKFLESPKLIRKGDWFHLISAEGGTAGPATSHMVIEARARSLAGPWENSPSNPIVHTWSADEPWWSKGHGTLIDDGHDHWWIVYHAYENGAYPLGRQTLIEPVEWTADGWVRAAPDAPRVPEAVQDMPLSDDFAGPTLGLQWFTWRDYNATDITVEDHGLTLRAKGASPADARLLLTTATDAAYTLEAEVAVPPGGSGGLVLFYSEKAFVGITADGDSITIHENAERATRYGDFAGNRWLLKIVNDGKACAFSVSRDGASWRTLRTGVEVSGMHHNRFKGFFALRPGLIAAGTGDVRFRQFKYLPAASPHSQESSHAPSP